MLSEVFGIFSGGVGITSVVLSLSRGFERFPGGGGEGDRPGYFEGVENFSDGVRVFSGN